MGSATSWATGLANLFTCKKEKKKVEKMNSNSLI